MSFLRCSITFIFLGIIHASRQDTPKEYFAVLGKSLNLQVVAESGKAIQFCRWDSANNSKIGSTGILFVDEDSMKGNNNPALQQYMNPQDVPGYRYFGSGLNNGTCGITIEEVNDLDITNWTCNYLEYNEAGINWNNQSFAIMKSDKECPKVLDDVRVIIIHETTTPRYTEVPFSAVPKISDTVREKAKVLVDTKDSSKGISNTMKLECCVQLQSGCSPSLAFFLDETLLGATALQSESCYTCVHIDSFQFTRKDNGKILKCVADYCQNSLFQNDSVPITVFYPPKILAQPDIPEDYTSTFIVRNQKISQVKFRYEANPTGSAILQKYVNDDYEKVDFEFVEVSTIEVEKGVAEVTVSFNPKPEISGSVVGAYRLSVENSYGREDVFIKYEAPGPEDPGFIWYWLLVPLIGFIIVVIVAVVIARVMGWCCFKNRHAMYHTAQVIPQARNSGVYRAVVTVDADVETRL